MKNKVEALPYSSFLPGWEGRNANYFYKNNISIYRYTDISKTKNRGRLKKKKQLILIRITNIFMSVERKQVKKDTEEIRWV